MRMLKRILISALIAVLILATAMLLWFKRSGGASIQEPYQAVPADAILFVENLEYSYISENMLMESRWWIDLIQFSGGQRSDSIMKRAVKRISASEQLFELLSGRKVHFSLHLEGKDKLVPLVILEYGNEVDKALALSLITGLWGDESLQNERRYETELIQDLSAGTSFIPGTFSLCCLNGLCLISPSSLLVEEAIRTLHAGERNELPETLMRLRSTAGQYVHANIYVNYARLPGLFYGLLREEHYSRLEPLSSLASWGELDLGLKPDGITLNGMLANQPGDPLLLSAFRDQDPVRMELHELIPSGITSFVHMGFSDRKRFFQDYLAQLPAEAATAILAEGTRIADSYQLDVMADLQSIADNELAWFRMPSGDEGREEEVMILETRSRSEAEKVLMNWIDRYMEDHPYELSSMRHTYKLDQETTYTLYRLPDPFYESQPLGKLFGTWFTFYDNCLLFGPSVDVLSRVIYLNTLHKTLVRDPNFQAIASYFSNRSNLSLYLSPYAFVESLSGILNVDSRKDLEQLELFLRRIPGFLAQFSRESELFYHSFGLHYMSQIREKALTEWESLMDTAIHIKPVLVKNHRTSEKEIFVQDAAGQIYLVNSKGRVLWKLALDGAIVSEVQQVDFYKNGKLQYLFNTRDRIHLLDRNGNYVERYPVSLRSPASGPMAVFDYDNSRDYRLFVPGMDRKIYLYNIEGKLMEGWKFGKTETRVGSALQHFRIGDRDYLLCSDRNRTYIMDRRGRERIRIPQQVAAAPQNPWSLDMNLGNKPRWVSTDTLGRVMAIYEDGSVEELLMRESTSGHYFQMEDLDQDGQPEFIFADRNELEVLRRDGSRSFSYKLRGDIACMPDIYKFSASDLKIGLTDAERNRIYLVNADGSLYKGFPLEGSTRFSIGYFGGSGSRFNLLVGSSSFLYNYSIE